MSLSSREQYQLQLIEADLIRSDPRLAALLSQFDSLTVGGAMPSWEHVPSIRDRFRAAARIVAAVTAAAALIGVLAASPRWSPSRCGAAVPVRWIHIANGPAAAGWVPVTAAARPHPQSSAGEPDPLPGVTIVYADSSRGRSACVR